MGGAHARVEASLTYGGPEVQKTRFWNPGLTTFHLIWCSQKWWLQYYLWLPVAVTDHSVWSAITRFGMQTLTFGVQMLSLVCEHSCMECKRWKHSARSVNAACISLWTLRFGVQTLSSVCNRCVRYANRPNRAFVDQTQRLHFIRECSQTERERLQTEHNWSQTELGACTLNMSVHRPNLAFALQTWAFTEQT